MKSILFIVLLGVAYTSADIGVDFVVDNIVNPLVNDLVTGVGSYLINSLANLLTGWIGKRDLNVAQVISQVQTLFDQYKDKLDQIISGFSTHVQSLFNILNLSNPSKSHLRVEYIQTISEVEIQIKQESFNLLNSLFQIFTQLFGEQFATLFGSKSRSVFGNVSSIINNLSNTINQILDNYGEQLLQTATNISQLSIPLLNNLQQQLSGEAGNLLQQIQQTLNQIQQ
ncbi:unnamed protein product [Brachionus calyciflorus]|uniref:Uncharacterized protein n=1 Tax=Brachionus calyciflorus TaxID=104777 RepID=A0A813PUX5_9BILA|nr:unnamed protein product [Brachionus calyciflorus]